MGVRETPAGPSGRGRKPTVRRADKSGGPADASLAASGRKAASQRPAQPSADEIAKRAYDIFLARGATDGSDLDDWLRAEQELTTRGRSGRRQ
jgi:hypothetical protein